MFKKIGNFSVKYRFYIVVFWLMILFLITWFAPDLGKVTISDQAGYLAENAPSVQAAKMLDQYFAGHYSPSSAILVFDTGNGSANDPAIQSYLTEFTDWVKTSFDSKYIGLILSPVDQRLAPRLISPDGRVALMSVGIKGSYEDIGVVNVLKCLQTKIEHAPFGIKGYVTGAIPITNAYKNACLMSAVKTTRITVILVIIILLIIYRTPVLPLVSLVTIGTAYGISRGLSAWLALHGMVISTMTDLFLVVLLFGAGTDYSLFIISRFRENMADNLSSGESAGAAIGSVGETIASSVGTVIVAVIAISFVSLKLFSNTGPSLAIGLVITLLAVMTFTPAMLTVLGSRAFWPKKPSHARDSVFWGRVGDLVTRFPVVTLLLAVLFLLPLAIYGQGQSMTFDMLIDLPDNESSKAGYNVIKNAFGAGQMQPVELLTTDMNGARKPAGILQIALMTQKLLAVPGVSDVDSLTRPVGRFKPHAVDKMRVDCQLVRIADEIRLKHDAMSGHTGSGHAFSNNSLGQLNGLHQYLSDLAQAFPGLILSENYRVTMQSLARLMDAGTKSFKRLNLISQLTEITSQVSSNTSQSVDVDLGLMLKRLNTLNDYLAGLPAAVPGSDRLNGYSGSMETLDLMRKKLTELNSLSSVFKTMELVRNRTELTALQLKLIDDLKRMKKDAEIKMPDAHYNPSLGSQEEQDALASVLAEMENFRKALHGLSTEFAGRSDGYFLPLNLAKGQERDSIEKIIDNYTSPEGNAARYRVYLTDEPFSPSAMDTVVRINSFYNVNTYQTGGTAVLADLRNAMHKDTRLMWILVSAGIIVVLILLLRSLVAPLYLMATIVLSYNATMGITRLVFNTYLHQNLTWFVPFFMFVLLMALGMDYNIFLMGRVKEEIPGNDTSLGVRSAVTHTGGIITSAGIIMAGTFTAMMSSSLLGLVQLGFAVTVGVLLDTFLVRTALVPAHCGYFREMELVAW